MIEQNIFDTRSNITNGRVFDAIGINRWNQSYKGRAIYEAAKAMAVGHNAGETIPYEPS